MSQFSYVLYLMSPGTAIDNIPKFPGLKTVICVKLYREVHRANIIKNSVKTRSYVSSLIETADSRSKFCT